MWDKLGYQHKIVNMIWETYGGFKAHELPPDRWTTDNAQQITFTGTPAEIADKKKSITHLEKKAFEKVKEKLKSLIVNPFCRKEQQKINVVSKEMETAINEDNGFYFDKFVQFCLLFGVAVSINEYTEKND